MFVCRCFFFSLSLNTQSYSYHSNDLSFHNCVNALSQPQPYRGSWLFFVSRSVLMSSPVLTHCSLQIRPFLCKLGPSCFHLALDRPSLSLTQFCRASASAKPLMTYMLFQQVYWNISAEKPCESPLMSFS